MRITAEFNDEGCPEYPMDKVKLTFYEEEKETCFIKYVAVEDFADAVKAHCQWKSTPFHIGKLPIGMYDASIMQEGEAFSCNAVLILPKRQQRITFFDTGYDMEMPDLLFGITVRNGKVQDTRVFCLGDGNPDSGSPLYTFPLGNVAPDGKVCWGQNSLPVIRTLKDLEQVMSLFISFPFNGDYFQAGETCKNKKFTSRDICEYVQERGVFDVERLLVPSRTISRFGQFLRIMEMEVQYGTA